MKLDISNIAVVIPTFNRPSLLLRSINSVLDAAKQSEMIEIIVVDDASETGSVDELVKQFPQVKSIRLNENSGPSVARNLGIDVSSRDFILFLDDDDTLRPDAFDTLIRSISDLVNKEKYPVFMFAHDNAYLSQPFILINDTDYYAGKIRGDFTPVIQRSLFIQNRLAYPSLKIGAESLLWLKIAYIFGIPAFSQKLAIIGKDAPLRLTDVSGQIARSIEYANFYRYSLKLHRTLINCPPSVCFSYLRKFGVYLILSGRPKLARRVFSRLPKRSMRGLYQVLSYCPSVLVKMIFRLYKYIIRVVL